MAKTRKSARNPQKPPSQRQGNGQIRIIAGKWRGRKLPVLNAEGLRPTTDKVKETLFNWLMADVTNSQVLDCFAGAGSLGFEALSRGARHCHFIELNKAAAEQIKANLATLKTENANVICGDALTALSKPGQQSIDIAFVDPPFRQGLSEKICTLLEDKQHLAEDALIYVEVESELNDFAAPINWQLVKEKTAGQVSYRLYQK